MALYRHPSPLDDLLGPLLDDPALVALAADRDRSLEDYVSRLHWLPFSFDGAVTTGDFPPFPLVGGGKLVFAAHVLASGSGTTTCRVKVDGTAVSPSFNVTTTVTLTPLTHTDCVPLAKIVLEVTAVGTSPVDLGVLLGFG